MTQDGQSVAWRKSSASSTGNCVEVGLDGECVVVRNTKDRAGSTLRFTPSEWQAFLVGVVDGEFSVDELRRR
jgi:hypothetical protein